MQNRFGSDKFVKSVFAKRKTITFGGIRKRNHMENLDWGKLPFGYIKTDYNIRCTFKDGKWGELS